MNFSRTAKTAFCCLTLFSTCLIPLNIYNVNSAEENNIPAEIFPEPSNEKVKNFEASLSTKSGSIMDFRPAGFLENKGQWESDELQFFLDKGGLQVALGLDRFTYILNYRESTSDGDRYFQHHIQVQLLGANPSPRISKTGKSTDYRNYFYGARQASRAHHYEQVTYHDVYPGIDVVFEAVDANNRQMGFKYSFIVHPGADPDQIRLNFEGQEELGTNQTMGVTSTDESDEEHQVSNLLTLATRGGVVGEELTEVFTTHAGIQTPVAAKFERIHGNKIGFELAEFDSNQKLVIDPNSITLELRQSTYYGSDDKEQLWGIDSDNDGNVVTVGVTEDNQTFRLSKNGVQNAPVAGNEIIVAKFTEDLNTLISATYLGGDDDDQGFDIDVDATNTISITGYSASSDFLGYTNQGGTDIVVVNLSNDLGTLNWIYGLGGSNSEQGNAIEAKDGSLYVAANASSSGLQTIGTSFNGSDSEATIIKLAVTDGSVDWVTYNGDTRRSRGNGIAVTDAEVLIAGSVSLGIPTTVFVAKYNLLGTKLTQETYADGLIESVNDLALSNDQSQFALVGTTTDGTTGDNLANLQNTTHQGTYGGGAADGFIIEGNVSDLSVAWSSYYGDVGSVNDRRDELLSVVYDCNENVIASGYTTSPNNISDNGYINIYQGGAQNDTDFGDAFMVKFDPQGTRFWGSYFGEGGNESGQGLALSTSGNILLCGITSSEAGITTTGTFDDDYNQNNKTGDVGYISTFCDIIFTGPTDATATLGDDVSFTSILNYCGSDVTTFSWTKDNTPISDGDAGFGVISNSSTGVLDISAVTLDAKGEYCVTVNTVCGSETLCANLEVVSLAAQDVCLDSESVLGAAGANQDSITLTFPNLESNTAITDAQYAWSVTSVDDVNGGNQAVSGSNGDFTATLPIALTDDLHDLTILPTAAGTYVYQLDISYTDSRSTVNPVTSTLDTTIVVYEFPTITGITPQPEEICEDGSSTLSFTTDININRASFQRIDTNTDLTGHNSGDENGINATSFDLTFNSFSNPTNQPLDAVYEITPFTSNGCAGPVSSFTITVNPNPELEFMNVTDTICNGDAVNFDFAALTSPNYQANGGTSISWSRSGNSDITPSSNSAGPFTNTGNINETLTNNSTNIQTVTYEFNASYLGCTATPSQNIVILPTITLDHSEALTQDICSGEATNLQFSLAVAGISGRIELDFTDNTNVTGDDDATLDVAANSTVSFPITLINSSNAIETVTATVTPTALLDSGGKACDGTPITFTFNVLPIPTVSNDTETICENTALNIDLDALSNGIAGTTYTWTATSSTGNVTGFSASSGNTITQTLQLAEGDTEGTVTYTVTPTASGCAGTAGSITVTVLGSPDISFEPTTAEICSSDGDPVVITANISGTDAANIISYSWELDGTTLAGETGASISASQPGIYTVTVSSAGGCSISENINVDEVTRAEVEIKEGPAASLCLDSDFRLTTTITGGVANTYQWLLNGTEIAGANADTYDANLNGDYQVVVNGSGACPDTSNVVTLTFFPTAVPNFTIDPDVSEVCPNTTLTLQGEDTNGLATIDEVSWSVSGASPLPTFTNASNINTDLIFGENQTGTDQSYQISLTLTTTDDCDSTFSKTVIHRSRPLVNFTFESENCPGQVSLATQATSGATEYNWELVSASSGLSISNPTDLNPTFELSNNTGDTIFHEVRLIAANASGCSDTLTQTLNSFPAPVMSITGNLDPICNEDAISLSSSTSTPGDGLSFTELNWTLNGQSASTTSDLNTNLINTGVTDSIYQIILTGTHDASCQSSDTVEITVYPDARAELTLLNGNTTEACVPLIIDSDVIGLEEYTEANTSDYLWQVDSAGTIVATATGITPPSYEITVPEISVNYILTAFSKNGCENDQDTITFTSYPESVAAFAAPVTACEGESVGFLDESENVNTYRWDFGDGESSDLPSPDHVFDNTSFTDDVVYTVTLTITSSDGCSDTETFDITVAPLPNASFTGTGGCGGEATTLTNNSEGQGTLTYAWSSSNADVITFDDASSVTPQISFADQPAQGDQEVTIFLTVTSEKGCQITSQQNIQVISRPTASLSFDSVQCLDAASFISTSTTESDESEISSLIMDYGDGSSESFNTPSSEFFHSYSDTGTYNLQIQAISEDGCRDTTAYSIRMIDVPVPVISSTQDPISGCGPDLQVDFDGSGSTLYGFETFLWDFGNGNTSTNLDPDIEVFAQNDTMEINYNVSLTINSSLCENAAATTSILVKPSPTAILESNVIVGCDDVAIQFFNQSQAVFIDALDTMYWDFGDGNTDTRFDLEVYSYTFQNNGFEDITYTVELVAASACGRDTTTQEITVLPFNEDPNIFLDDPERTYCTVDTVRAEVVGLGGTVGRNVSWFLDGVELTEFNAQSIAFPAPAAGNYQLILNVEFPICGGSRSDTIDFVVLDGPEISFEVDPQSLCLDEPVEIINTGPIRSNSTIWDLGDGTSIDTILTPGTHTYESAGTYTISMALEGLNGCFSFFTNEVEVIDLNPSIGYFEEEFCEDLNLHFLNTGEYDDASNVEFQWNVENELSSGFDGPILPLQRPTNQSFEVTASLTATQNGCTETDSIAVRIDPFLKCLFEVPNSFYLKENPIDRNDTWDIHINEYDTFQVQGIELKIYNLNTNQVVYFMDFQRSQEDRKMRCLQGCEDKSLNESPNDWADWAHWNGRDMDGQLVPHGMYYYLLNVQCCQSTETSKKDGYIQVLPGD